MTSDSLTPTALRGHHFVLVSHFESSDSAEVALADLVAEGLSETDYTLLVLSGVPGDPGEAVEAATAPFADGRPSLFDTADESAENESEIGAGIATSSPDDDVSMVQEMDDSETAAEDMMYPREDHSFGDEQTLDVRHAANTGFFDTTRPEPSHKRPAELDVDEIDLPGLGVLLGEGSFGSSILDKVFKEHETSLAWLAARLNQKPGEKGVSISKTGAVLAIDVNAEGPNPGRIEDVLLARGATWVRPI